LFSGCLTARGRRGVLDPLSRRVSRGTNLLWEINGTEGDLQLTATGGQVQIWEMDVRGGKGAQSSLVLVPVPVRYRWSPPQDPGPSTNVAQAYARFARDYREGTHFSPLLKTRSRAIACWTRSRPPRRLASAKRSGDNGTGNPGFRRKPPSLELRL